MPGKHKAPLLGWHPSPAGLGQWARAEAERREVKLSVILNEALAEKMQRDSMTGGEVIHLDGDPRNNDPSNLEIRSDRQ